MTMIIPEPVKCPICKNDFEINILASTNMMCSPDLDLRPGEMQRSTMNTWIHECPNCGYVASDFNETPEVTKDFIQSDSYKNCDNHEFKHHLAKRFYRQYLISNDNKEKYYSLLHCAWACDDRDDLENSILIRRKCLEYLDSLDLNDDILLQRADILRRSNQFDTLIEEYSTRSFPEDIYNKICTFQVEKAIQKDNGCYTVEDVIKN